MAFPTGRTSATSRAEIRATMVAGAATGEVEARVSRTRRLLGFLAKYFLGMVFCQSLPTSFLVVGWSYRLAQRAALKRYWRLSGVNTAGESFAAWLCRDASLRYLDQAPAWFLAQPDAGGVVAAPSGAIRALGVKLAHSLWLNFKIGFLAVVNTWVLTVPGCVLWWFAWHAGWHNSFNKGYEQAAVGPLTGVLGVLLFIAAMFLLPLAQARQAVTGEWRSFYQFRLVWRLIRSRWLDCLLLAALYSALSVPVMLLKTLPVFLPQMSSSLNHLTADQAEVFLKSYYFWSALVLFPAYLWLRLAAARVYAHGVVAALKSGALVAGDLAAIERDWLQRVGFCAPVLSSQVRRSGLRRIGVGVTTISASFVLAIIWFTFVAQIFISEFFNYHPVVGWLNQPLVQLPWLRYLP